MNDSNQSNLKFVRFQQRLSHLNEAFAFLKETLFSTAEERIKNAAIIKAFEMTFELSWKCLKDLLEYQGITAITPRDVLKESFKNGFIEDGQVWIHLLDHRNELVHVYHEDQAISATETIRKQAYPNMEKLLNRLKQEQ